MEKTLSLYVMGDRGRLDSYISEKAHISRTFAQKLIKAGYVVHNENPSPKPGVKLKDGDIIFVRIPKVNKEPSFEKEDIPLKIIYEDEHILVVNKDRGMVVHPAPGHYKGTLVNALLYHSDKIKEVGGAGRSGIVHRLDKNTSGVLIVAKTYEAHQKLSEMFKMRKIKKEYIAVVHGKMKGREGIINLPIGRDPKDRKKFTVKAGGKNALTRWKVKKSFKDYTLLSVFPETGRTHQIRVHLKYVGNPVVGDPEYGPKESPPTPLKGQALHAYKIELNHPISGEFLSFKAPIPDDMENLIRFLENTQ